MSRSQFLTSKAAPKEPEVVDDRADVDDSSALKEYKCPISLRLMKEPVTTADGHSYEREASKTWLLANDTSPLTGAELDDKTLRPNHALRKAIETWVDRKRAEKKRAAEAAPDVPASDYYPEMRKTEAAYLLKGKGPGNYLVLKAIVKKGADKQVKVMYVNNEGNIKHENKGE